MPWSGGAEKFLFPPSMGWEPAWAMQKGRDKKGVQQPELHGTGRAHAVWRENV